MDDSPKKERVPHHSLCVSVRLCLALMCCMATMNMMAQRVNMSVVLVCMLNHTAISYDTAHHAKPLVHDSANITDPCHADLKDPTIVKHSDGPFTWSKHEQGIVLGSFFWGYLATGMLGGHLADKHGGKRVYLYFNFFAALATALCAPAALLHDAAFVLCRGAVGLFTATTLPAIFALWSNWAPPLERTILLGISLAGTHLGIMLTMPLAAVVCDYGGWQMVFYTFGAFSFLVTILWYFVVSDKPDDSGIISERELKYIRATVVHRKHDQKTDQKVRVPWRSICTSLPVWAILVSHTCCNWGNYLLITTLPSYMHEVLHFDIKSNGLLSALPYLASFVTGQITTVSVDRFRQAGVRTGIVRKVCNTTGFIFQSLFLLLASQCTCEYATLAVSLFVLSMACHSLVVGGFVMNNGDIAPRLAGSLFGFTNTAATLPGILAPYMATAMTEQGTAEQWRNVFWLCAAILTFGALFFAVFATDQVQPWACDQQQENNNKNDTENNQEQLLPCDT